jgi:hypothetical protein
MIVKKNLTNQSLNELNRKIFHISYLKYSHVLSSQNLGQKCKKKKCCAISNFPPI